MPTPYPPVSQLAVVGDRRTAAMVAADGNIGWMCLPNYDSPTLFGALLDAGSGGYFRVGPEQLVFGRQFYLHDSPVLVTRWEVDGSVVEVTDFMPLPENERPQGLEEQRVLIRRVRVSKGSADCVAEFRPRYDFKKATPLERLSEGAALHAGENDVRLWCSQPLNAVDSDACWKGPLKAGEEVWLVMEVGSKQQAWSADKAKAALEATLRYWSSWSHGLTFTAPHRSKVMRSAKFVHLLSFAPAGSLVAAPTCSLPERIGGKSNYDYRYAWLRDASLSLASLGMLGDTKSAKPYMDWLTKLGSCVSGPLQPLYKIDGEPAVPEKERSELAGYRGSSPVRTGNDAYLQYQPDSYGYLAECSLIYLKQGGEWKDAYFDLIKRLADHAARSWQRASHGIWELPDEKHYVSSKVMNWVTLDRAIKIVQFLKLSHDTEEWQRQKIQLHADVMNHGWSDELQSFRQAYGENQLDGSVLLISVMGFLEGDHPRMLSTLQVVEQNLSINGLIYRFDPKSTLGADKPPMGEFEGAFLPVCFFMASAFSKAGMTDKAERILEKIESATGAPGLIAEEMDPRSNEFLGNTPLIFSLVEHIRALIELDKAKPLSKMALMIGQLKNKVQRRFAHP